MKGTLIFPLTAFLRWSAPARLMSIIGAQLILERNYLTRGKIKGCLRGALIQETPLAANYWLQCLRRVNGCCLARAAVLARGWACGRSPDERFNADVTFAHQLPFVVCCLTLSLPLSLKVIIRSGNILSAANFNIFLFLNLIRN